MEFEQYFELAETAQQVVLDPSLSFITPLFFIAFFNELLALFPYALVVAGQLLFLQDAFTLALFLKLLVFVALPIALGGAIGTIPFFVLAYYGGKPLIEKYEKFLRFSWEDVERASARFQGKWYAEAIFLFLRCIPILPSFPVTLAVGVMRIRFWPYFFLTVVGFAIRMMLTFLIVQAGLESLSQLDFLFYNN